MKTKNKKVSFLNFFVLGEEIIGKEIANCCWGEGKELKRTERTNTGLKERIRL